MYRALGFDLGRRAHLVNENIGPPERPTTDAPAAGLPSQKPPPPSRRAMLRSGLAAAARRLPSALSRCAGTPLRRASSGGSPSLRLEPELEEIISKFKATVKSGRSSADDKPRQLVDNFGLLQRHRVRQVLLVCSDYDSYTFEEEGLLTELVYSW